MSSRVLGRETLLMHCPCPIAKDVQALRGQSWAANSGPLVVCQVDKSLMPSAMLWQAPPRHSSVGIDAEEAVLHNTRARCVLQRGIASRTTPDGEKLTEEFGIEILSKSQEDETLEFHDMSTGLKILLVDVMTQTTEEIATQTEVEHALQEMTERFKDLMQSKLEEKRIEIEKLQNKPHEADNLPAAAALAITAGWPRLSDADRSGWQALADKLRGRSDGRSMRPPSAYFLYANSSRPSFWSSLLIESQSISEKSGNCRSTSSLL